MPEIGCQACSACSSRTATRRYRSNAYSLVLARLSAPSALPARRLHDRQPVWGSTRRRVDLDDGIFPTAVPASRGRSVPRASAACEGLEAELARIFVELWRPVWCRG